MADVHVSTQLQQWSFEKFDKFDPSPAAVDMAHADRTASSASSPDLSHPESETLRLDKPARMDAVSRGRSSFQERYLSSEEDLSPLEANSSDDDDDDDDENDYDSDVSIHEVKQCFQARKLSVSRWAQGRSCDKAKAVTVSYVVAGRPKVIELASPASPTRETARRRASMLPPPTTTTASDDSASDAASAASRRHTMMPSPNLSILPARSQSPAISIDSQPSTTYSHSNKSALNVSDTASSYNGSSLRSPSPAASTYERPPIARPASAAASPAMVNPPRRSSLFPSPSMTLNRVSTVGPVPPLTPQSPEPHSFLSSDPYESTTVGAASPIIKSPPHKRLRSISQRLSLAKIAIAPSTRKWDSRIHSKAGNMPLTPASPYSPMTPMTAPPVSTSTSPLKKLQRHSRMAMRPSTPSSTSYNDMPSVTLQAAPQSRRFASERMVARGANEREPMLELPPYPSQSPASRDSSIKSRKVRKRKSLMDLL